MKIDSPPALNDIAASEALSELFNGSPTVQRYMELAHSFGVTISLFRSDYTDFGATDEFIANRSGSGGVINWDPFSTGNGRNIVGSFYSESPIMLLAHELVHAGDTALRGPASENAVIAIVNAIAAEMNMSTGSHYETTRTVHDGKLSMTDNIHSQTASITRPDCP